MLIKTAIYGHGFLRRDLIMFGTLLFKAHEELYESG